jgi:uncharacterized protein YggL (DUF469 family)
LLPADFDKPRSRRLRKKLRIAEFQEFGFEFEGPIKVGESDMDAVILEIIQQIEGNNWCIGMGCSDGIAAGFISPHKRGTLTEGDRQAFRSWVATRPWNDGIEVRELRDCWHGW